MFDPEAMASALVDHAMAAELVPWACPCDFGPEGRYRLEELVAAGPGSLVYRATDRSLSSEGFSAVVAVKIFRTTAPLRDEALSLRRVSHPNVLAVLDRGATPDGQVYLVAEFVTGGDLGQVPVPMEPRQAAEIIIKIAGAVQAAHSAGVVHCDLKPANILITAAGEPKLGDFGLARWESDSPEAVRGNIAFMSPEQFMGSDEALTPPSDLYALGGLLYYLLTGRLPLGESAHDVTSAHHRGAPVPSPGIERDLDRICGRATARSRRERYHSAGELADDLGRWLAREPIAWTRPSALRRTRLLVGRQPVSSLLWTIATLGLMAAVGVFAYNARQDRLRRAHALTQAVTKADERVASTAARVRKQIEWFSRVVSAQSVGDLQDQFLPTIVWLQYLGESPVIQTDGHLPAADERMDLLRKLVGAAKDRGGGAHLETRLAEFSLARLGLAEGEFAEPRMLIESFEGALNTMLDPGDPVLHSLRSMRLCVRANELLAGGGATDSIQGELKEELRSLDSRGDAEATRRLVQRVLDRCTSAGVGFAGGGVP